MIKPVILWFRQDLRLGDNLALKLAIETGLPIIPVYIFETDVDRPLGGASRWWLYHSLRALSADLKNYNGQLILRQGNAKEVLAQLIKETQACALFFNERYTLSERKKDLEIQAFINSLGLRHQRSNDHLLFHPTAIKTKHNRPFKIFTPFWKACLESESPPQPWIPPQTIRWSKTTSESLESWKLQPMPDWAGGLKDMWQPGEKGANLRLRHFLKYSLSQYKSGRDFPSQDLTSRLSPHLTWGEISPREIFHTLLAMIAQNPDLYISGEKFLSELGWREFCYYLLYHNPAMTKSSLRPEFKDFPWQKSNELLKIWQQGLTGYPIVDAGMRQLWHTGWMHNRIRMVVASFLVKNLLISWQEGEAWFWDTLVDADLANNCANWQWIAGCGMDAAPYFRIFNPITQSEKFDPKGEYIRRWIPELSQLNNDYIHKPWLASPDALTQAQIILGKTYPKPIVDHKRTRQRALEIFFNLKR